MNWSKQKNKRIGIFGLGITGISAYKNLVNNVKDIVCYDDSKTIQDSFVIEFGSQNLFPIEDKKWINLSEIIISPGIHHSHLIFQIASINRIVVTSDIELFIEENTNSEFIFVTGTNGKSTVTALTGHVLRQSGLDYHMGGNIGTPVMSLPHNRKGYILELSSFQIDLLKKIDPKISVITNITPDHLDRHKTIEVYAGIKEKIFTHNAFKIIGVNSDISYKIYNKLRKNNTSKIVAISTEKNVNDSIICNDQYLEDSFFLDKKKTYPSRSGSVKRFTQQRKHCISLYDMHVFISF